MPATHNPRLSDAIEDYLTSRLNRGIAKSTVSVNRTHLLQFLAQVGNIQVRSLAPRHIDMVYETWSAKAPGSINAGTSSLKMFFDWCGRRGSLPRGSDLMEDYIKHRKIPEKARLLIPVDQFPSLLDAAEHPRDRMLVALGLYLFLRQSEIITLRVGDVDFTNQEVAVTVHKTKQFDRMPISAELDQELRRWLEWYTEQRGVPQRDWYLVPAKSHIPFTTDPVTGRWISDPTKPARIKPTVRMGQPHRVVQPILERKGYATFQEGVHTLRRSGARARFDALRDQGYDGALQEVRAMLHHSSVAMTEYYLGIQVERMRRNESVKGRPLYPTISPAADKVLRIAK